jgi:hypothetical protein
MDYPGALLINQIISMNPFSVSSTKGAHKQLGKK